MTSGLKPFYVENNKLCLKFEPKIPANMFTKREEKLVLYDEKAGVKEITVPKNSFLFKFLGVVTVIYHNPLHLDTFGKQPARITGVKLIYTNGKQCKIKGSVLREPYSHGVRNGKIRRIDVTLG